MPVTNEVVDPASTARGEITFVRLPASSYSILVTTLRPAALSSRRFLDRRLQPFYLVSVTVPRSSVAVRTLPLAS